MGVDVFDKDKVWKCRDGGDGTKELNTALANHAHNKRLSACCREFSAAHAAGKTNYWSHSILINAHSTCGDATGAKQALEGMRAAGHRPRVASYTAALKAICGAADLAGAVKLLSEMEADFAAGGGGEDYTPNVRTAHCFLRGCLVGGGVQEAMGLLARLGDKNGVWASTSPGVTANEYAGLLCAQALRLDEASSLADRALNGSAQGGRSPTHAAACVRVAICRGYTLLGEWRKCDEEAKAARGLLKASEADVKAEHGEDDADDRRGSKIFREHQREEALIELAQLEGLASRRCRDLLEDHMWTSEHELERMKKAGCTVPLHLLVRRLLPLPLEGCTVDSIMKELRGSFGLNALYDHSAEPQRGTPWEAKAAAKQRKESTLGSVTAIAVNPEPFSESLCNLKVNVPEWLGRVLGGGSMVHSTCSRCLTTTRRIRATCASS